MVVALIVGLRTVTTFPFVAASYQIIVPVLGVAENTTCPETQTAAGLTDAELTVGTAFTVAVTDVRVAETHPFEDASA